ncbi:DUF6049 family protein [Streptomyces sp. NPDC058045]|uniref:DUF6049 family protein n=1 Tax=Streptomyces sp. NPDC058045 TaxID=3346311 RepID=UPI0036E0EE21
MAEAADHQRTSASPARRWLRRTGTALAGAPLLAGLLQLPAAATAPVNVRPVAAQSDAVGSHTVDVSLDSLSPDIPEDGDTLTVTGTATNKSRHAVNSAELGLRLGSALHGRSAIDDVNRRSGYLPGVDGNAVSGSSATQKFSRLAPGVTQHFKLSVPVDKLKLGEDGVYPLGVGLAGRTSSQPWQQMLGFERTLLPYQSEAAETRTKTTVLWPLISSSHVTAETGTGEQQTPMFRNDDLAKEIAPGGRLNQMLSLGKSLDVTWVVDPDLLASVNAMTGSYLIKGPDGKAVPGRGQKAAAQWLDDVEKAVAGSKVVALPFADPDLASLAHTGRNVTGSISHLKDATDVAAMTVETILHTKAATNFAWPAEGALDPSVVDVATSAGADTIIARSDSFPEHGGLSYTPTAARPIGGGTTAVVADAPMSTAFSGDMTRAENSTLAIQNFLAQSLMINAQDPGKQRSIVVAPQRMPTASQAQTMAEAVRALQDSGWSQAQDLTAAAKASPDPRATTRVPSSRDYPASLRRHELPRRAFDAIKRKQDKLNRFQGILADSSRVITPFGRAMDREMSTSWRGRTSEARQFRKGVSDYLAVLTSGVGLIQKSETKLSGRSATIPVTVQNNLLQGVDHLTLRLTSTKPTRLKIGDGPYDEKPVLVSSGHSQSLKFTTNANANGPVEVLAQLYTDDGRPYGKPVSFTVDVNEVTPTVMLVIAGGVLLLVLAGFRMYTQRKRAAARRAATENAESPETADSPDSTDGAAAEREPVAEGDATPVQPSDEAADTAPESAGPSGPGERVDR